MTGDSLLHTHALGRRFGALRALDEVSLRVGRGDVYGLLGLNGAGKTTLMRCVLGLMRPSSGRVELFGRDDPRGLRRARARIGALVEAPAFDPRLSGRRNFAPSIWALLMFAQSYERLFGERQVAAYA